MISFRKGQAMAIALVLAMVITIRKSNHSKSGHFVWISNVIFNFKGSL